MSDGFAVERVKQTLVITLTERAEEPGLVEEDLQAFPAAVRAASQEGDLTFLVLTGRDAVFCRGGSTKLISTMSSSPFDERDAFVGRVQSVVWEVLCSPLMTVAAVNGLAVGPGADLALACDVTLAGPNARISMWYNRLGLVPDLGFFLLADVLGYKKAMRACADSAVWNAEQLTAAGLAEAVDELPEGAAAWQRFLGRRHRHLPDAYAAAKRIRIEACRQQWELEMKLARQEQAKLLGSPDLKDRLERTAALQSLSRT